MLIKRNNLETANKNIQQCQNCDLCKLNINIKDVSNGYGKLYGWLGGSKKCKYFFVGMNPSRSRFANLEYAFGGPDDSVGKGRRFTDCLKSFEIFEELYCTNLVKCSTATNDITDINARNCMIHLLEEIDILKPEKIIAMGKKVYDSLFIILKENKIDIKLYNVFHPNYVYRFRYITEEKYKETIKEVLKS
jgi:uracil-DNA glycosylase family 4